MIKIPVYQQQQSVGGVGPQARASGLAVEDPGKALQQFGAGLDKVEDGLTSQRVAEERILHLQREEDGKAYAGKTVSDAHVQWQDTLQQRQQAAKPGAPNFTPEVLKDFDTWSKTAIEQAPTDAAKRYLSQHLLSYRTQLAGQALTFEGNARVAWRKDEHQKSVGNWSVTVAKNPGQFDVAMAALRETLPEVGPIEGPRLLDAARKSLSAAAASGAIMANPESAYKLLSLSTLPEGAAGARDKSGTITAPTSSSGNRGIANNNPGNIVKSSIAWDGKVDGRDPKFETFDTPEAGIRAIGKNLLTYQDKHGRNTVESIVAAWAPASENNTAAYTANVAKVLGVKPDQPLDVKDPATMKKLVGAIITQENGQQPYSDAQIDAGISAALGNGALPKAAQGTVPAQPSSGTTDAKTGVPWVDAMTLQERLHYLQQADTEVRRRQQIARADMELKLKDQEAQALSGKPPATPLALPDFVRAYGQVEGPRRYGEFRDNLQFGANIQQVAIMSPGDQQALLDRNAPTPDSPGYAQAQRRSELLRKAIDTVREQRAKDPIAFTEVNGLAPVTPINWSDPSSISKGMAARTVLASQNSQQWGVGYQVVSDVEASQLGDYLTGLQPQDKARVLGQIYQSGGAGALRSISSQLKDKNETLAIAGMLASHQTTAGRSVAQLYLEGKDAIAQKRAKIDQTAETGIRADIYKQIDGVYITPQARDAAADVAYAVYAKFKAEGADDIKRAVNIATGGLMDFNGAQIAKPYGWDDGRFRDWIGKDAQQQIVAAAKAPAWGMRVDGTRKGNGFLGVLKRPDGGVSTEISIGVQFDGKEVEIPSMVPTLTKDEVNTLLALKDGQPMPDAIVDKAVAHAKKRLAAGKSPFATDDESPSFAAGGRMVTAAELAKSLPGAKLQTFGDGTYMIRAGSDVVRKADGQPLILQARQ